MKEGLVEVERLEGLDVKEGTAEVERLEELDMKDEAFDSASARVFVDRGGALRGRVLWPTATGMAKRQQNTKL